MYRGEAEKVNYDLATAEDKVQELEDNLEQKRQNIHKLNTEITRALEQKNYNSTRVVHLVTSNKERDASGGGGGGGGPCQALLPETMDFGPT